LPYGKKRFHIPPSSFTYEGFTVVKLFNVTEEEAISALKVDLLKKGALQVPDTIEKIRARLSSLLSIDNLKIGKNTRLFRLYGKRRHGRTTTFYTKEE